ncbi:unnamed protein product [Paramecium sonneborni]|uniref:Uncharacterized protein n=1 Tax=Paramecium sonneborni TaxID=65129 RepID=A0A8S1R908_9CILI|nr:unnamed protein product [Paramecium sonneborni]
MIVRLILTIYNENVIINQLVNKGEIQIIDEYQKLKKVLIYIRNTIYGISIEYKDDKNNIEYFQIILIIQAISFDKIYKEGVTTLIMAAIMAIIIMIINIYQGNTKINDYPITNPTIKPIKLELKTNVKASMIQTIVIDILVLPIALSTDISLTYSNMLADIDVIKLKNDKTITTPVKKLNIIQMSY